MRLGAGLVAVVTGGGSGIGLAIARALAQRGCRIALIDRRSDRLLDAHALLPSGTTIHPVDVSDQESLHRAAAEIRDRHGAASLLVTSAGVSAAGPFALTAPDVFDDLMRINFDGTVRSCRAFLPQLRENARGGGSHIVTIGSCFGWVGFPGKTAYSASKAAVRAFSEALRGELRPEGIGVTVVYPGPVDTHLVRDGRDVDDAARAAEAEFLRRRGLPPERVAGKVLRAIERDAARAVVGFDYRAIDLLVRIAPDWAQRLVGRAGQRAMRRRGP